MSRPGFGAQARAAILAGLAGGLADILAAFVIFRPATPTQIFQAVGSGLTGPSIFQMGTTGVIIGALAHFGISIVLGVLYLVAAAFAPVLLTRPLLGGVVYGTFVYGIMNAIVVPLSLAADRTTPPDHVTLLGWLANMLFGVVLALVAARLMRSRR
jgi:hypothetical protein